MDVTSYVMGFAIAALLVGGGVSQLAGHGTPVGPPKGRGRAGAWGNVLFGVGLALGTAARIPSGHRLLWDGVLLGPASLCAVGAFYLYARPALSTFPPDSHDH
ncbi:hypothetical protein ACOT81_29440 [Streptomyces sp. WI04-05B]|uniref:hypothetical protein n=1 Tax=Streptomyces TaxID=1883 RepID=UPI0029AD533B|nr:MULTISPECIES: hypothetical protein [unclassified Streptomyces]MDX2547894.1 hypothetical protein [Streptomyces sp. WI04-05B]MDX2584417.1 hypothetical protein [Streptomyces sp. WI04-05A]MDX3753299.1 hypothetical protein [Streptomyces sp. AK08-02]